MVNLRFGQQNVGRANATANVLKVDLGDYNVMCIQEPYILSNTKVEYLHKGWTFYYTKTVTIERTWAVVLVLNRDFPVVELMARRDIVAIKLVMAERQTCVHAAGGPCRHAYGFFARAHNKNEGIDVIILGNFNAKNWCGEIRYIRPLSMVMTRWNSGCKTI